MISKSYANRARFGKRFFFYYNYYYYDYFLHFCEGQFLHLLMNGTKNKYIFTTFPVPLFFRLVPQVSIFRLEKFRERLSFEHCAENAHFRNFKIVFHTAITCYITDKFYFARLNIQNTNYMITIKEIFSVGHERKLTPLFIFQSHIFNASFHFRLPKHFTILHWNFLLTGGCVIY